MKRFILVSIGTEEVETPDPLVIKTDDVEATVRSMFKAGYDILADFTDEQYVPTEAPVPTDASVAEIVSTLLETKVWGGEDGSQALMLIDLHDETIEDTYTLSGEPD